MRYDLPDGSTWTRVDGAELARLAAGTARSPLMRSEPDNSGCSFDKACSVLKSLVERDEDVSEIIPDRLG